MAAGLGFKDFVTGEVLTAADVDGYLMQNIWVFASAAARDAAVTSPQEGNFAYLKDTNVTTYYTGSAWANLDTTGMTNPMTTTGDTIYSSSGSTPARLGIGTSGQVLTVSGAGIPSWATAASGGGLTLLSTTTLSGASTTISTINQGYKNLYVVLSNVANSATFQLRMEVNSSHSLSYGRVLTSPGSSGGTTTVQSAEMNGVARFLLTANTDNATGDVFDGVININQYSSTATMRKAIDWNLLSFFGGYYAGHFGAGSYYSTSTAISSLTFSPNTGTFSGGTVLVYGVN
jgi:hypothetical protein